MSPREHTYYGVGLLAVVVVVVGWMVFHLPSAPTPMMLPGAWTQIGFNFGYIFVVAGLFFIGGLLWEWKWPTPVLVDPPKDEKP